MGGKDTNTFTFERVPYIAVEVVVTGKEQTTADGEGDGGDTAEDVVMGVLVQFAVSAEVEEAAGGVVGSSTESVTVGEESEK